MNCVRTLALLSFLTSLADAQEIPGQSSRDAVTPARKPAPTSSNYAGSMGAPEPNGSGAPEIGSVTGFQKIGLLEGGFTGELDPGDRFGSSVAQLGDLDGDGIPELAVGARNDDDGGLDRGAVWILFLNADRTVRTHRKISSLEGGFTDTLRDRALFGASLAALGDFDGDGIPDLAVGAPRDNAVWLLFLNADGTVRTHLRIDGEAGSSFGSSVACIGDLDDDGVIDLAVGDVAWEGRMGAVYVLRLETDGTVKASQQITFQQGGFGGSIAVNDLFGSSITSLGDFDRDGIEDIVVGARGFFGIGPIKTGEVWVLFLDVDGTVKSECRIGVGPTGGFSNDLRDGNAFGGAVSVPGDLDGDGFLDLCIGAPRDNFLAAHQGAVWVCFLRSPGPAGLLRDKIKIDGTVRGLGSMLDVLHQFGESLARMGDLNRDGVIELAVGASGDNAVWVLALEGIATIDFETGDDLFTPLTNGQAIPSAEEFGRLVEIHGVGPNEGTAIFASNRTGPNAGSSDPDLLVDLGNVLLLQENSQQSVPGIFDDPDDALLGGTMVFDFPRPARLLSVDLIDICPGPPAQDVTVTLFDQTLGTRTYSVPGGWTRDRSHDGPPGFRTLSLEVLSDQPGFMATATAAETEGFDEDGVVRMEVGLSSSGALDNVRFDRQADRGVQTVTLNPSKDNTLIQSSNGLVSNGMGFQFFAGRVGLMGFGSARRGVIAFDVAGSLPAGATIINASLTLHLSLTNTGAHDVGLHELTQAWGEGTSTSGGGSGDTSTDGDATWIHTFFDTEFWDQPGGDFQEVVLATRNVDDPGRYTWTSSRLVASVQSWIDDPGSNFGWIVIGDESFFQTAQGFDSRENPDVTRRPVLTIEYSN